MIERFISDAVLKAKSVTGASSQAAGFAIAGMFFVITALIFLSLAGYAALLSIYGSAIAWLIVGSVHLLIAGVAMVTCVYLRNCTRAQALLQIRVAEQQRQAQQSAWKFDPSYLAIGLEVAKVIGIKRLIPIVLGGILAAGFGSSRRPK
jgi:hypothetical protein